MKILIALAFALCATVTASDGTDGYGETEIVGVEQPTGIFLKVTVLASEVTLGKDGEQLPVVVDFSGGDRGYRPLLDGKAVSVGASRVVEVPTRVEDLRFVARTAYRVKLAPSEFVVVLRNGDDLGRIIADKPIHKPIGRQRAIADILGRYVQDGKVRIKDSQRIYLFELGVDRLNGEQAEFADFQDLVLLVGPNEGSDDF